MKHGMWRGLRLRTFCLRALHYLPHSHAFFRTRVITHTHPSFPLLLNHTYPLAQPCSWSIRSAALERDGMFRVSARYPPLSPFPSSTTLIIPYSFPLPPLPLSPSLPVAYAVKYRTRITRASGIRILFLSF